ncbi:Crp/Fnr family transcriptional regulator [Flavivirga rizhaonensis]|uniref:Crp/Fnr family transcriptional regulator n=1 Tax=Flavivirga rizhaonensis TaxID=2559571 RepID=UPI001B87628E|nr:Crp/Fnr family transcriptional regulator [Flavivirga rizhaonensis]
MSSNKVQHILNYFEDYWPIEETTAQLLKNSVIFRELKRKEFILKQGEKCNYIYFVVKGVLKLFHTDDNGNQHNLQFATEKLWLTDFGSLYNDTPSELYIQALEPTSILQIKKKDLFVLYDNSPLFDRNMRIVTENAFIEQQNRLLQTISSTAIERYQYFLNKYPDLSNRISNVQIASYLGVTPEFLSSIRKKTVNT